MVLGVSSPFWDNMYCNMWVDLSVPGTRKQTGHGTRCSRTSTPNVGGNGKVKYGLFCGGWMGIGDV